MFRPLLSIPSSKTVNFRIRRRAGGRGTLRGWCGSEIIPPFGERYPAGDTCRPLEALSQKHPLDIVNGSFGGDF
jgi:hypothetical protein